MLLGLNNFFDKSAKTDLHILGNCDENFTFFKVGGRGGGMGWGWVPPSGFVSLSEQLLFCTEPSQVRFLMIIQACI